MKNIHILPTDKPSRFYFNNNDKCFQLCKVDKKSTPLKINQHIYITSDEEINPEKDWILCDRSTNPIKAKDFVGMPFYQDKWRKVILTTDQDLIKDGIQEIPDEFLEWFVKNPSCEFVEVLGIESGGMLLKDKYINYNIIIPKEEPKPFKDMQQLTEVDWEKFKKKPFISKKEDKQGTMSEAIKQVVNNQLKQETFEEALSNYIKDIKYPTLLECAEFGAKWQQEQYKILLDEYHEYTVDCIEIELKRPLAFKKWLKQFKK